MGEELERRYITNQAIDLMARMAKAYALSGYFDDASGELQAFVKISAGRELGLLPFESMSGIAIISGKPVVGAGVLAGLVKAHPKYDYRIVTHTEEVCEITFFEEGVEIGTSTFSMEDARRAGLAGKKVWQQYPKNMTFARAMSNGVAFYTPDVTNGRVYVESEIEEAERPARRRDNALSTEVVPPNPEQVVDVEPEPEMDTAVQEPMKGTASATLDPVEQLSEERVDAAEVERTAAEIAAEAPVEEKPKRQRAKSKAEDVLAAQDEQIALVRTLVLTGVQGEDRRNCHESMKFLDMWGQDAPRQLWLAFGKKALAWETLEPAFNEAIKKKLLRQADESDAAAATVEADPSEPLFGEKVVDVEPEPPAVEDVPWGDGEGGAS